MIDDATVILQLPSRHNLHLKTYYMQNVPAMYSSATVIPQLPRRHDI